jgi:hypothetical protein
MEPKIVISPPDVRDDRDGDGFKRPKTPEFNEGDDEDEEKEIKGKGR